MKHVPNLSPAVTLLALLFTAAWSGGEARDLTAGWNGGEALSSAAEPAILSQQQVPPVRVEGTVNVGGNAPREQPMKNPFAGNKQAAEEGEGIFVSMNCDACHWLPPGGAVGPSLADGRWRWPGSGGIFQSIYGGRPKGMPAYGGTLDQQSIWKIVTYLEMLEVPPDLSTLAW